MSHIDASAAPIDSNAAAARFDAAVLALRAAGEETRLRILIALAEGELAVAELTQVLGQSQPRISRHLRLMLDAGLIERRREGAWAFFRLAQEGLGADLARFMVDRVPAAAPDVALDRARRAAVRARRQAAAEAYFARNAAEWDHLRAMHAPEAAVDAAARAMLTPPQGERFRRFVDLGSGAGQMLTLFADCYDQAVGYDLNQPMLATARARLEAAGLLARVDLRQADILRLPEPAAAAAAVVCHQVLHFLDDPAAAIQEAARILTRGGALLLVDFAPHGLETLRERHAHRRLGFSEEEIAASLTAAGLTLTETRHIPPPAGAEGEMLTVSLWLAHRPAKGAAGETPVI